MGKLLKTQKQAARIILDVPFHTPSKDMFEVLRWMPIDRYFKFRRLCMIFECSQEDAPDFLSSNVSLVRNSHNKTTRYACDNNFLIPKHRTVFLFKPFFNIKYQRLESFTSGTQGNQLFYNF